MAFKPIIPLKGAASCSKRGCKGAVEPTATIHKNGSLALGAAASRLLGENRYVVFHVDREARQLGLELLLDYQFNARKLSRHGAARCAKSSIIPFLREVGLPVGLTIQNIPVTVHPDDPNFLVLHIPDQVKWGAPNTEEGTTTDGEAHASGNDRKVPVE